ncbi:hypothetical protein LTR97_004379 [Elasticomyces elasticus]|uniref:Nucleoporin Nup54 alpha-helical domain-containing protein n=1 Tax=Elasticomyces elasticus TaxID=574655 RepID=A0AAN8A3C8_9PEZI|nr:hypothetical protein LTR97_004379 [Elasticomyces elasticus]
MAPLAHPSGPRNAGIPFTMLTPANSTPKQPNTNTNINTTQAQPKPTAAIPQAQPKQPAAMSLFGTTNAQPSGTGLFGSAQPQQQPQQQQSLFANNNNTTQPSTGTGLFGSSLAQPQQQSTSLFSNLGNNNQQAAKPSLFGAPTAQPQQQQQPSLFSNLGGNSTQQQPAKPSLFSNLGGYNSTQQPATNNNNSLFGSTNNAQNPQQISNWGGSSTMNQQQPQGSSIFGLTSLPPDQLNHSLLAASQYRASQQQSQFAGKLSMGQQSTQQQQQPAGAVKVHANDLRGTTRFADCIDDVKTQFEMVDTMIQKQERFCREIQAMLPKHSEDILCLEPSVQVVKEMAENVEKVLIEDARVVNRAKQEVREKDAVDFKRCQRVVEGMMLPAAGGYGYGASSVGYYGGNASVGGKTGEEDYDTDLIGNYFIPLASILQTDLDKYTSILSDIESHMRVIESSAQVQAQQLAARRAGVSGPRGGSDETIKELAETLTGFEQSILGVAGVVGECREGVEGLVMGRVGQKFGGNMLGGSV